MDQLYLIEVIVDKLNFNHEVEPVPQKKQLSISVTFGNFAVLELRSEGLGADVPEKSSSKREVDFNSGKSYLFSSKPEDLINALRVCPLEVTVFLKNNPKPIGVATISWDDEFADMVQSSMESAGYITPASINDIVPLRQKVTDDPVGNINLFLRLSCFGKSVQTQFQIIPPKENMDGPTQFLFKSTNTGTTFQCQRYGIGLSSELIPIAPIINTTEIGLRPKSVPISDQTMDGKIIFDRDYEPSESICPSNFMGIDLSPVTSQKISGRDIHIMKKKLSGDETTIQSLIIRPEEHKFTNVFRLMDEGADVPNISISTVMENLISNDIDLTGDKLNKLLCKNKDCPGVKKFANYGLGPLATGKGLGTIYGKSHSASVPYGVSNTYGNLDSYGPYGCLLNPVNDKTKHNRLAGGGLSTNEIEIGSMKTEETEGSVEADPRILQIQTIRKMIHDESCKKLLEGFDKVLNSYKKSLGPCGKPTCPLAQNVLDCSKLCHGEFIGGVENECDCDEISKPDIRDDYVPGDPACGQKFCPFFHKEVTEMDNNFLKPPKADPCENHTCPFRSGPHFQSLSLKTVPPPYGSVPCGSPLCKASKLKDMKVEMEPIHWDCDDPLPKGPCENPDCPIEKEKESRRQKSFLMTKSSKTECQRTCNSTPSSRRKSMRDSSGIQTRKNKNFDSQPPNITRKRCCGGGSIAKLYDDPQFPTCNYPQSEPEPCDHPLCPLKQPKKSCYVTIGACGSFECPFKEQSPPCCGDPGVEPCMDPSCPFTPIAKCGNISCPFKEIPQDRPCPNPACSSNPQPVIPCDNPDCPFNINVPQYDDFCAKPDCPFKLREIPKDYTCSNPECPFNESTPMLVGGDATCDNQLPKVVCSNPRCPFNPTGPECPLCNSDNPLCGGPSCPFSKDPVCTSPNCPFKNEMEKENSEDDKISCSDKEKPCIKSTCKWLSDYVKCTKCKGLSKSGATCDNPHPPSSAKIETSKTGNMSIKTSSSNETNKPKEKKNTQKKISDKGGDIVKDKENSTEKRSEKEKGRDKLPEKEKSQESKYKNEKAELKLKQLEDKENSKKEQKFVYDCGDEYPGVKIGHRYCSLKLPRKVPHNMGWLWNTRDQSSNLKPRGTGWRPGAMAKVISERIRKHRESHGCEMLNLFGKFVGKKMKKPLHISNSNISIPDKPTLHVKKKDGIYVITMNPLKDPLTRKMEENESPYLDCTPMQFKIIKNKDKLTVLNGDENEDDIKNCMCGIDDEEDKSSESELEIEFTPPAGIIHPEMRKRKHSVVHTDTQYDPKDCPLIKKKDDKGKSKEKGKKGKGGKGAKGAKGSAKGKKK